jgi:serine/threonine protein kinase
MSQVGPPDNSSPYNHNAVPLPVSINQRIIANRYELLGLIGRGDVSRVYRSLDRVLNREVAVKVLREENIKDQDAVVRFYREARFLASLTSPYIIKIYDYGHFDSAYFIVMEYVEGITLKELEQRTGELDVEQALSITGQILQALTAAHNNKIIHRDIKPHNILIQSNSQMVKLTDFGVARTPKSTTITNLESGVGSIDYMAPEQSTGGVIGPTADIYSTGVVLFEMLAGRLPFEGTNQMQIALQHLYNPPPSFKSLDVKVPAELERVVMRALDKDPARRYQTAAEMRAALSRVSLARTPAVATSAAVASSQPPKTLKAGNGNKSPVTNKPAGKLQAARRPRPLFLLPLLLIPLLLVAGGLAFWANSSFLAGGKTSPPETALAAIFATPVSATPTVTGAFTTPAAGLTSPDPEISPAPVVTQIPTVTATRAVAPVPAATTAPTATPTLAPTPSPEPTLTPAPSFTPRPTVTSTPEPVATATATIPPTTRAIPTDTPAPPGATPTVAQSLPATGQLDPYLLQGSYKRPDGTLYGRPEIALYGSGSGYNQGRITFEVKNLPSGSSTLILTGLDDERVEHCNLQIILNDIIIFDNNNLLPDVPHNDNGEGGADRYWGQFKVTVPPGTLVPGRNTLILRNTTPWNGYLGIPYILINSLEIVDD